MKTTKQFALVALLVLGATLYAGTPAHAQQAPVQVQLICQVGATDPDFEASGLLVMEHLKFIIFDPTSGTELDRCNLTMVCSNLTPGATYSTNWGTFTAGPDGRGGIKKNRAYVNFVLVWWGDGPNDRAWLPAAPVYRLNPDGTSTLVLSAY